MDAKVYSRLETGYSSLRDGFRTSASRLPHILYNHGMVGASDDESRAPTLAQALPAASVWVPLKPLPPKPF
eukprot:3348566-Pleurochrysis_carterae.AAC.6